MGGPLVVRVIDDDAETLEETAQVNVNWYEDRSFNEAPINTK